MNNASARPCRASQYRLTGLNLKCLSLLCLLSFPPLLPAQEAPLPELPSEAGAILGEKPAANRIVREIDVRFRGPAVVDRARVLSLMRLKVGEPWTQEKEEDDLRAFIRSGDLLNATIDTVDVGSGVRVIVTAEARQAMGELIFQGNTVFNSERLREEVSFRVGEVVDDTALNTAKATILELYKKKGYPDAIITYDVSASSRPGFARVTIIIDEGGRGVIHGVQFEGNTVFSSRRLRGEIESDNRNWLLFLSKRKLDREKLERDMAAIQDYYGDHGYFDARVTGVDSVPTAKGDKIDLVFHIVEGPQYTTANVGLEGNKLFDNQTLLPVFQLESGQIFSLAGMKADIETIQEFYGSHGYAEARVTPRIQKLQGNQLNVTYAITEGGQFKVGRINIIGNEDTREEVIRRELAIEPGDDYNTIKIRRSLQRVRNLDYFEDQGGVDFMPVTSNEGADFKDINITVREKKTGSLQFGAGFSSTDSLVGMIEVTQRNFDITNWPSFTGGGQRFRMTLRAGTERKDFLLSFTEPWFLNERLSLGFDLFWTEKTYLSDYYDQRDVGGSINLRRPVGDNSEVRLTYTLQQVEIYDVPLDASDIIKLEEGDYLQSRLGATWVTDTRDNLQLPTRGYKFSLEGTLSGEFIGGDVDDYTITLSGQKHWKMPWNTVLSLEGAISVVDTFSDDRVPIFDRRFLGGATNLRGWDYREVGPLDSNLEPIGGGTSAYLTTEYNFPIIRKVRGVVFVDAGFVNADSWDFSGDEFVADAGFGLRFRLPFLGPLKLDYGIPIHETDNPFNTVDSSGQFHFSMDYRW
jgi:outer membrane protein insertion porin family